MSEFASAPPGEEASTLAPGHEESNPRLLREAFLRDISRPGSQMKSMAIYKPSPAPSGEPQPHRIVVGHPILSLPIVCTRSGAVLAGLENPLSDPQEQVSTHQRSDGAPVILTKSSGGLLRAYDGDDYRLLYQSADIRDWRVHRFLAYNDPERGQLRVVTVVARGSRSTRLDVLSGDTAETLHSLVVNESVHCLGGYVWSDGHARRQRVVTAGTDGLVVVIDPEAGQIVQQMRGHHKFNVALACFESDESPPVPYVVVSCETDDHKVQVSDSQRACNI
jgi:WD40 repeat protein